jgi:tetratricopeptide (TPR) repeat protein
MAGDDSSIRISSSWFATALALLCCLPLPLSAKSSPYKTGLHHYARGEFQEAITQFQKALTRGGSRDERSKIHKYLGLSQYTMGRQAEAEENFSSCLKLDRNCSIVKDEALDESVIPFFKKIRDQMIQGDTKPVTRVRIESNAKNGEVALDGIIAGSVGQSLTSEDGTVEVEVRAPGYRPRKLKISVTKAVENTYQINLEEIPKGPSKEEIAAAKAAQAKAKAKARAEAVAKERVRAKVRAEALARERFETEERQRQRLAKRLEKAEKEAAAAKNSRIPPVLPREEEPNLALKDAADPVEEPPVSAKEKNDAAPSRDPPLSVTSDTKASSDILVKSPLSFAHFLPFGIGQFKNDDILLGTVLLTAQGYALYGILDTDQRILQAQKNLANAQKAAEEDPGITPEILANFRNDAQTFIQKSQDERDTFVAILAGSYVLGVLHAIILRPDNLASSLADESQTGQIRWSVTASHAGDFAFSLQLQLR